MNRRFPSLSDPHDQRRSRLLSNAQRAGLRTCLCTGLLLGLGLLPWHTTLADDQDADVSRGTSTLSITKIDKVRVEPQFDALMQVESTETSDASVELCFGNTPGSAAYQVTVYSVDNTPPAAGQTRGFSEYHPASGNDYGEAESPCAATSPWGMSVPVPSSGSSGNESGATGNTAADDDLSLMLLVSPE